MLQSVLAGLAPNIAMEIATRSISFWTYQVRCAVADLLSIFVDISLTATCLLQKSQEVSRCVFPSAYSRDADFCRHPQATFQAMVLKNAQERNAVLEKRLQT